MRRKFLTLSLIFIGLPVLIAVLIAGHVVYEIQWGDTSHLSRENIQRILARESLVFYNDGRTQLGSFFGEEHRIYTKLTDIPIHFQQAIVASEDGSFFQHMGIDIKSTFRAAYRTLFQGKREGASTITQQTIKNLFGRPKGANIFWIKYIEFINAVKLEKKYSKQDILEFYLNQFGVTSNGRGVGIASKYYFNKDVSDLNITESAFIVGSVKNPSKYNPFTKRSALAREKARENAKIRKNYVLKRLFLTGKLDGPLYETLRTEDVPFEKGKFRFNRLTVLDLVKRHLSQPEILRAVGASSVEQLSEMGLSITTTIRESIQKQTEFALQRNLSRIDMILKGFKKASRKDYYAYLRPQPKQFYVMQLEKKLSLNQGLTSLQFKMGEFQCTVPPQELLRVGGFLAQSSAQKPAIYVKKLLSTLEIGDFLQLSLRELSKDSPRQGLCGLEVLPTMRGGNFGVGQGQSGVLCRGV